MKSINSFSLGAVIAGAYIGAGFVSGQELWQFFGRFGELSIFFFLLSTLLIAFLSVTIINFAREKKIYTFEGILNPFKKKWVATLLVSFEIVFYLSVFVIMLAGIESLLYDILSLNKALSGFIFALLVTIISLMGTKGVVSTLSLVVPFLVIAVAVVSVISILKGNFEYANTVQSINPLISNPLVSALLFVSYNFYAGIGVFASVAKEAKTKSSCVVGGVIGGILLVLLGGFILLSMSAYPEFALFDLPMMEISTILGKPYYFTYSFFLALAMLSAAISSLFPVSEKIKEIVKSKSRHFIFTVFIALVSFFLSLFGFRELISVIYPLFGYAGFLIIALLFINIKNCK